MNIAISEDSGLLLGIALFPPVEYMALLIFHPKAMIEAHENFQKQTYRNRYYIQGPNGKQLLQVPVSRNSQTKVKDVGVSYSQRWQTTHLRSLDTAYNSSPWYLYYRDKLVSLLDAGFEKIWELNMASIKLSSEMLGCSIETFETLSYKKHPVELSDLRDAIHPKSKEPMFCLHQRENPYHQVFSEKYGFTPGLSILDLIFNEGPAALTWLKALYCRIVNFDYAVE